MSSQNVWLCFLIQACLKLLKTGENFVADSEDVAIDSSKPTKKAGVLVPVPEYPLYSATLEEYNMKKVSIIFYIAFMFQMFEFHLQNFIVTLIGM